MTLEQLRLPSTAVARPLDLAVSLFRPIRAVLTAIREARQRRDQRLLDRAASWVDGGSENPHVTFEETRAGTIRATRSFPRY